MTQNRMMNSIRDGPRDQPRASAKRGRRPQGRPGEPLRQGDLRGTPRPQLGLGFRMETFGSNQGVS